MKITYDHTERLLTVKKTFNGATEKTVATNAYDELEQMETKALGATVETLN